MSFCGDARLEAKKIPLALLVFFTLILHTFIMKKIFAILISVVLFVGCASNPLTGKRTMAFVDNSQLFPSSFAQYEEFINENTVITGTNDAARVTRVGTRIAEAAQKWLASEGYAHYLDDYRW